MIDFIRNIVKITCVIYHGIFLGRQNRWFNPFVTQCAGLNALAMSSAMDQQSIYLRENCCMQEGGRWRKFVCEKHGSEKTNWKTAHWTVAHAPPDPIPIPMCMCTQGWWSYVRGKHDLIFRYIWGPDQKKLFIKHHGRFWQTKSHLKQFSASDASPMAGIHQLLCCTRDSSPWKAGGPWQVPWQNQGRFCLESWPDFLFLEKVRLLNCVGRPGTTLRWSFLVAVNFPNISPLDVSESLRWGTFTCLTWCRCPSLLLHVKWSRNMADELSVGKAVLNGPKPKA